MMNRHIDKGYLLGLVLAFVGCSTDDQLDLTPSDVPVVLNGTLTRGVLAPEYNNLYGCNGLMLSAKVKSGDTYKDYFTNSALTVGDNITGLETYGNGSKLTSSAYYPLSDTDLYLFSHTGKVTDGMLSLTSGTEDSNDMLISNGEDGTGTIGSSNKDKQATTLVYRHVMTKLEVAIDNTDSELQVTKPENIEFKMTKGVAATGTYGLTTSPADATNNKANATSGTYTLTEGTHYLVPSGENLTGIALSSLKINDYTATTEDLATLVLPKVKLGEVESDLVLTPGLSYKLTFTIKNLKVTSIAVSMIDWDIKTGNGEWGYDPYKVNMTVTDGYENSADKQISKVILKYKPSDSTESFQYIGGVATDGVLNFVTLPTVTTETEMTADLYTENGLLIQNHKITYTPKTGTENGKFTLSLSANGMVQKDGYYEITTPLQFYNFMNNPQTDSQYKLTENMDLDGLPAALTPMNEFPTGAVLDGNGHSILHLNLNGNALVLTNKGTIENLSISTGTFNTTAGAAGGICATNNGAVNGCVNNADITGKATIVGGICGSNNGTITACVNTGNIGIGGVVGGICGENNTITAKAILACVNTGTLNKNAEKLGGVIGNMAVSSNNKYVSNCFWLTGTARKVQSTSNELAVGSVDLSKQGESCENSADLSPERLRSNLTDGGITMLNNVLASWKFVWTENANGTYTSVWPWPTRK